MLGIFGDGATSFITVHFDVGVAEHSLAVRNALPLGLPRSSAHRGFGTAKFVALDALDYCHVEELVSVS